MLLNLNLFFCLITNNVVFMPIQTIFFFLSKLPRDLRLNKYFRIKMEIDWQVFERNLKENKQLN